MCCCSIVWMRRRHHDTEYPIIDLPVCRTTRFYSICSHLSNHVASKWLVNWTKRNFAAITRRCTLNVNEPKCVCLTHKALFLLFFFYFHFFHWYNFFLLAQTWCSYSSPDGDGMDGEYNMGEYFRAIDRTLSSGFFIVLPSPRTCCGSCCAVSGWCRANAKCLRFIENCHGITHFTISALLALRFRNLKSKIGHDGQTVFKVRHKSLCTSNIHPGACRK